MVDDAQRWHRVKQVFQDALERPADERERFVRSACGDDRELQGEVASLLLAHAAAGNFAQGPAIAGFTPSVGGALLNEAWAEPGRQPLGEHARLAPGQTFGSYRVEGLAGRRRDGGSVSRARHETGTRRRHQGPAARVHATIPTGWLASNGRHGSSPR